MKLKKCADSAKGASLLAAYGDKTDLVQKPLAFVPTVLVNEVSTYHRPHIYLLDDVCILHLWTVNGYDVRVHISNYLKGILLHRSGRLSGQYINCHTARNLVLAETRIIRVTSIVKTHKVVEFCNVWTGSWYHLFMYSCHSSVSSCC